MYRIPAYTPSDMGKMCACLLAQKENISTDIFLPQTEHEVVAAVMSQWQSTLWQSQTRLNTTKTDRKPIM